MNGDNNQLIAEFMGYEVKHNKCYSPKYNDGTIAPMQFHKSWDWLMPVVQKIGDEYLNTPFDETYSHLTEQYENIWTLEDTYNAVVEFVKEQNEIG